MTPLHPLTVQLPPETYRSLVETAEGLDETPAFLLAKLAILGMAPPECREQEIKAAREGNAQDEI